MKIPGTDLPVYAGKIRSGRRRRLYQIFVDSDICFYSIILFQGAVYLYYCNCTDCLYVFPASVQKLL